MSGHKHLRHPATARRVGLACALLAGLLLWPLPASGGYGWDLGIAAGYAGLVCAATLYLYPLRAEGLPHKRLFTLSQHRRIGWIALTLSLVHAAALLIVQPQVGHYLLPSAPVYMLFGTIALIALATLVATGLSARKAMRKATPPRPSRGAVPHVQQDTARHSAVAPPGATAAPSAHPTPWTIPTHAILAGLLLACLGIHIVGSGQLADSPTKIVTLCLLLALPLIWAAVWRKRPEDPKPAAHGIAQSRCSGNPVPAPFAQCHPEVTRARAVACPVTGQFPPRKAHHRRMRTVSSQLRG